MWGISASLSYLKCDGLNHPLDSLCRQVEGHLQAGDSEKHMPELLIHVDVWRGCLWFPGNYSYLRCDVNFEVSAHQDALRTSQLAWVKWSPYSCRIFLVLATCTTSLGWAPKAQLCAKCYGKINLWGKDRSLILKRPVLFEESGRYCFLRPLVRGWPWDLVSESRDLNVLSIVFAFFFPMGKIMKCKNWGKEKSARSYLTHS